MTVLTKCALIGGVLGVAGTAGAEGVFIPAAERVDMVHDMARHVLYIGAGPLLIRYDTDAQQFLAPLELGGNLMGMDLSPDGNTLLVADSTNDGTHVWIHEVDLDAWESETVLIPQAFYESGTYTVAFGNDGAALITSRFAGSGWVPMRSYDPASGEITTIASVRQDTMLCASGDRSVIGYAESNISSGEFGRYRVSDGDMIEEHTGWFVFEIGVNHDGTQFAVPTYGGTFIYDALLNELTTIGAYAGEQPIAAAYDGAGTVYFPWAQSSMVRAYRTDTFELIGEYDAENTFSHTGNHAFGEGRIKLAADASLLFVTVDGGVRMIPLIPPCPADVNGDAMVDVVDLLAVLAAWGLSGVPEDVNGDGLVDEFDLLIVLADWGPCP